MKRLVFGLGLAVVAVRGVKADSFFVDADSYINSAQPIFPGGVAPTICVRNFGQGGTRQGFLRFDLDAIPSGTRIERATLTLWVDVLQNPGIVELRLVQGAWDETTLRASNAPPLGTTFATLNVAAADRKQFVSVDVTSQVDAWIDGTVPNYGIALVPSALDLVRVEFDSKENTLTSHPAMLELLGSDAAATGASMRPGLNPLRLALLRWYDASVAGTDIPVGNNPAYLAFDGANIWVANGGSNSVTELRASDGAVLGSFPVGSQPFGLAFDGTSIWVSNAFDDTVTKLRASDGASMGSFPVGNNPLGVAFDGANVWITNLFDNSVTKLRAIDGVNLGSFPVSNGPAAAAFDGANIWVTSGFGSGVTKLRASDGANLGFFSTGSSPRGVAFDGANVWVANTFNDTVTKLRAIDGANLGTFPVGNGPFGMAFDGANVWIANGSSSSITKLRASDGTALGTFPVGNGPLGIVFDGANIWVGNQSSGTVSKR